jgi:hypothetical protein
MGKDFEWSNTVTGNVYGKLGTPDGTQMMTSTVPPEGKLGTHVVRVLPQGALAAAAAVDATAGCCASWPPARVAACERAADVRRRIVQVTESGSSYLLGRPEQVSGNRGGLGTAEQGLTTGEALALLEKEAGIGCCQLFLLNIIAFIVAFFNWFGYTLYLIIGYTIMCHTLYDGKMPAVECNCGVSVGLVILHGFILYFISYLWIFLEFGSTPHVHLLGMQLISTYSLKPWRSPVGFLVHQICEMFLSFTVIGYLLTFPCGCCGTPYQSWLNTQFSVMWVRSADYSKFMAVNEKRIRGTPSLVLQGNMPPLSETSPAPQQPASSPALQRTGSVTMPTLENWKWTAGNTVTGNVYGEPGTPDGTQMMTSTVPPEGKLGTHVVRVLPQGALAAAAAAAAGRCACGRLLAWLRVSVPLTCAVALSR